MDFRERHFYWLLVAVCFCALCFANAELAVGLLLAILICMALGKDND